MKRKLMNDTINDNEEKNNHNITCEKFVINVTDEQSFDQAYRNENLKNHHVVTISCKDIAEILKILQNIIIDYTQIESPVIHDVILGIATYDYKNTILNFECCTAYGIAINKINPYNKICSNKHTSYDFYNSNLSKDCIDIIVHIIKKGGQVICADFSAKALISNWDEEKFGARCPFIIIGTDVGSLRIRYGIEICKKTIFPQLVALASLAIADSEISHESISSMTMKAMLNTIKYTIKKEIDDKLNVKVLSVAIGHVITQYNNMTFLDTDLDNNINIEVMSTIKRSDGIIKNYNDKYNENNNGIIDEKIDEKNDEKIDDIITKPNKLGHDIYNYGCEQDICEKFIPYNLSEHQHFVSAYGTSLMGIPVHTAVTFSHMPGSLIISSLHLCNLTQVDTNIDNIVSCASNVLGRQRSVQIEKELIAAANLGQTYLRERTSSYVAEIATSATNINNPNNVPNIQ